MFPPDWVDPKKIAEVAQKTEPMPLTQSIRGSTALLIVTYDSRTKRVRRFPGIFRLFEVQAAY